MLILRLLLVARARFLRQRLGRLPRKGRIVVRMAAMLIFENRTRIRMVIFFPVFDIFLDSNDVSATTAVVTSSEFC
jgi:hypothetical protein